MRFVRYRWDNRIFYGIVEGDNVRRIDLSPFIDWKPLDETHPLSEVKLLAPAEPSKVVAVGLNYIDHADELKMDVPSEPILFLKPTTAVVGPGEPILYPAMSKQVDFEAEVGVVIKDEVRDIRESEVKDAILGYTCANDVTARDLQRKDGQWGRCKSFDTFAPIGPWIDTEVDPLDIKVESVLNGKVMQSSTTANMIFDIYKLVSFISKVMTLLPGDVIMTGTPPGVGPMQPGDEIEIKIEGIGTLRNTVVNR
jgi:2-keto-4-pentenoate hydratase/2-oxohepta-3-ene-1,7-dioic acid hydratase in catechol pathway